jgi:hypothetical protein
MMSKGQSKALAMPDKVMGLLAQADKRNGFPEGTMYSVMQQEVGGQLEKFLGDPSAYHYGLNKDGKRVAGHTGKVSTAFGPFGILESTGKKPGYGVEPLKDKSLEEQVRFAADYLAARSKDAGGLKGGLAGYGEGAKYANQVAGRVGGIGGGVPSGEGEPVLAKKAPQGGIKPPAAMAATTALAALNAMPVVQEAVMPAAMDVGTGLGGISYQPADMPLAQGSDPWLEFLAQSQQGSPVVPVQDEGQLAGVSMPDFMAALRGLG